MAAETLGKTARIIRSEPPALQLRYLQTLVGIAGEGNSTIIPFQLESLDALKGTLSGFGRAGDNAALPAARA